MFKEALTHNKYLFGDFGLWPQHPTLVNFKRVLGYATPAEQQAEFPNEVIQLHFWVNLLNSVIFTTVVAVGSVTFSSLAAFAFARLRWRGRDAVFGLFLAALLVPPIFGVLPNFILMKDLGWVYTWKGLLAPYLLMQPFALFFLRQFFLNIPNEIEDAAKIDGLGPWGLYRRICLPLSSAPIATLLDYPGRVRVERIPVAATHQLRRARPGAHGRAGLLRPQLANGRPGLDRLHGGHNRVGHPARDLHSALRPKTRDQPSVFQLRQVRLRRQDRR